MESGDSLLADDGDAAETFEGFVATHHLELVRFAFLLTRRQQATAEDLVQTVLTRVLAAGSWEQISNPVTYMRRAIVNEWSNQLRRLARLDPSGEVPETALPNASDAYAQADQRSWVWHALDGLSAKQRAAVVMRYYLDLDDRETAQVLDCAPASVRSHIHRALPQIAAALEPSHQTERRSKP